MHKNTSTIISIAAAMMMLSFFSSGCASIVNNGPRKISVNSTPSNAAVTVVKKGDKNQNVVWQGRTPATATLSPTKSNYIIKLELDGYHPAEVEIESRLSGWYFGNLIFGGLLGLIIVDPLTGAMWDHYPARIQQPLTPVQASVINNNE